MKSTSFTMLNTSNGASLGVRDKNGILDIGGVEHALRLGAPGTTDAIIKGHYDSAALSAAIAHAQEKGSNFIVSEADAKFAPCVTSPGKIICVGLNYMAHAAENNAKRPPEPILFSKFNSALNSHGGTIVVSKEVGRNFDYETELVAVIGKTARNVSEAEALDHVFGYCTGNDFTERDQQFRSGQWLLGKAGDGWAPIGPWLVTADQIDPENLNLKTLVNGTVRQESNTRDMIFSVRTLVSFISRYMTLEPGDLIFTGTPEGVIQGYPTEKRVWLKAGDTVVSSIEKLGDLKISLV